MDSMERILLRVVEAAQALGISRAKAYELIASGEIPSVRLGGCVRVPIDALHRMVDDRTSGRDEGSRQGGER